MTADPLFVAPPAPRLTPPSAPTAGLRTSPERTATPSSTAPRSGFGRAIPPAPIGWRPPRSPFSSSRLADQDVPHGADALIEVVDAEVRG